MSDDQPRYSDMLILDTSAVMAVLADEPARPARVYAYDAYPIACAIATDLPLLSLDRGQRHAAKSVGVRLVDLDPFLS